MKPRRRVAPPTPIEGPGLVGGGDAVDAYDAVDQLLSEIPEAAASSCTVHVYKFRLPVAGEQGTKLDRCRRMPLDQFDVDKLPELFGGGDFTLRIIDRDHGIDRTARVSFDPALYPVPGKPSLTTAAPAAAAPGGAHLAGVPAGYEDRLSRLEAALNEARDRHVRFLETMLQGGALRSAPPSDPLTMIKAVMEIVQGAGGRTPAKEIGEAMRMAFDMAREAGGGEGGGPSGEGGGDWMSVLEKFAPKILEVLTTASARPAAAVARVAPAAARPAPGPAAPPAPAPGPRSMFGLPENPPAPNGGAELPPEWAQFAFLRKYTDLLIEAARKQTDPAFVASVTYNRVPEAHLDALETFVYLTPEARYGLCVQLDPRLAECAAYIETVAEAIRGEFEDDEAQEDAQGADATPPQ